jgi:putative nucleotidyltransferase with HDIG domain
MAQQAKADTISFIKRHLEVMNLTILLSISVVFLIVVKFVYGFLEYIPMNSILVFLAALLMLFASIYGLAHLATSRALRAIESYSLKLSALLSTSHEVQGIQYSDVLLEKIMETAISLTGADGGSLLIAEEDAIEFRIVRGANAEILRGTRFPRDKGIVGWVIKEGRSVRISDAKKDERHFGGVDKQTGYQTRSILCVPLMLDGSAVGALEMVKSIPDHFTTDEEEMLQYFAGQAALSMKNSQYLEDMRIFETHLTNILVEAIENISEKKGHLKMVAKYALLIGRGLNLSDDEMRSLYRAAILHDIGFLRIDLHKVKTVRDFHAHAQHGFEILRQIPFYRDIASFVLHHHERYDGKGYPHGLAGEMIPPISRIICIAEAFDVMTNVFSFKKTGGIINEQISSDVVGFNRALAEIKENAGTQFDPNLVDTFLNNITEDELASTPLVPYTNKYSEVMNTLSGSNAA